MESTSSSRKSGRMSRAKEGCSATIHGNRNQRGGAMKITTIGKGNVGGGLARLWRDAGHEVDEIGREGGDASGAEAVLLAVPSAKIGEALGNVSGIDAPVIDATNFIEGERPEDFDSLAEYVKSLTGGP